MSEDIVKVMVDYYGTPKSKRSGTDTGGFERIHKGMKCSDLPVGVLGLNLVCRGKKIR